MKIVSTVEARMGSSRLPGKAMMKILGKPMLELLIERLKRSELIDEIVIATTINPKDIVIEELAEKVGVKCFRGSEEDVLIRVLEAAKSVKADIIVEITADCPLIDPNIIDMTIKEYLNNNYDYVCNVHAPERTPILSSNFPSGFETQVFSVKTLEEVASLTDDSFDHEHVSIYIYTHPNRYKVYGGTIIKELSSMLCRVLGFKEEGIKRSEVYKNGKYNDAYLIGLLKDEFYKKISKKNANNEM